MTSKKNKWRGKRGELQFKRITSRYQSDNSPMGYDTLYVRIWPDAYCVVLPSHSVTIGNYKGVWINTGTWHNESPVKAAHDIKAYLNSK
jgi:hypothetical protein